jgi:protein-L-isoaspartate(D-aspartate) O-methyltransferase
MDRPAVAYDAARMLMVDGQVRPNKVSDMRIIGAMRRLPRENFVPPHLAPLAYSDSDVPLGRGRAMVEPMTIARLVQLAGVRDGDKVLVVGAGSGYGAALLAACGGIVTALEDDAALVGLARTALAGIAGVTLVSGPLGDGWPDGAPYDIIFIEGAVEEIPAEFTRQLRAPAAGVRASRLVAVRVSTGRTGQAVVGELAASGLALRADFDCVAPLLPSLRRVPGFVF